MVRLARILAAAVGLAGVALAIDPDRDFSGKWILDTASSNTRVIRGPQEAVLTIAVQDNTMQCTGAVATWNISLDETSSRYQIGEESHHSKTKWEGSALLVNTIVSGPREYSLNDRWSLSRDHNVLTIERQTMLAGQWTEGVLYYRREGARPAISNAPPPGRALPLQNLVPGPTPAAPTDIVVRAGTKIPLSLRNAIDTKHSREGDRVYLDTVYPVVVNNHIVIPRGSWVIGTVTTAKAAGVVKGKGELYIRFDSLTLPNGVTRDFRSRLVTADTAHGKVDRKEGTVTGERDKSGEAKTTAEGAGIGAGVGGIAGAAAGHAISGMGIGAAAGAAAGLATVLVRHKPDASLPRGTTVEMLLDRDLFYQPSEIAP